MLHVTSRAAVLGLVVSSLLSCGDAADDERAETTNPAVTTIPGEAVARPEPGAAPKTDDAVEAAPAHPARMPAPDTFTTSTSPAFTWVENTSLVDDGYDAPLLASPEGNLRFEGDHWTPAPSSRADVDTAQWVESALRFHADFRALGRHAPSTDPDWFSPSAFGSLPSGHVYVFGWAGGELGVADWSAATGATFSTLPTIGQYAVFPRAVLARSDSDVWVAASATSAHFGKDFPGCPSILIAEQDNGIVAHFDGQAWTSLAYRAHGALSSIHAIDDEDAVELVADETYSVTTDGRWTPIEGRVAKRAREAGWKVVDGRVHREREGTWEPIALALPGDREGRFVPVKVHVVGNAEVWIEGQVVTGAETPPHVMPPLMWLRAKLR